MFTKNVKPDAGGGTDLEASKKKREGGGSEGDDQFATEGDAGGSVSDRPGVSDENAALEEDGTLADLEDKDEAEAPDAHGPAGERAEPAGESADEPIVEFEEPTRSKAKARKKSRKKGRGGESTRAPSDSQVLERMLEKNEMILQLNKKNQQLESKLKALEDKRLRLTAEFENYRKRTRKEWDLLKHQAKAEVILEILAVVDDFERAFSMVAEKEDDFAKGIRLIQNNLLSALSRLGVREMKALHEPFDPNFHMAMAQIEHEEVESNHVAEILENGYMMDGKVIRPAKVIIAK